MEIVLDILKIVLVIRLHFLSLKKIFGMSLTVFAFTSCNINASNIRTAQSSCDFPAWFMLKSIADQ